MKSELSFLMDLFLNEELPAPIKKLVSTRIREVEKELTQPTVSRGTITPFDNNRFGSGPPATIVIGGAVQSPSMQKIMERHADLIPPPPANLPPVPATPAAAAALAARANLVRGAASEKPEPGRNGPRKF